MHVKMMGVHVNQFEQVSGHMRTLSEQTDRSTDRLTDRPTDRPTDRHD